MKILASSLTYPLPNGVTTSLDTSVDGFSEAGHEIRIVAPEYKMGKARKEHYPVPSSVLTRTVLSLFGKEERTFGLRAKIYIDKIAKSFQPDAYWLHTLMPVPNAFEKYMMASGKPKVLTYHTLVERYGSLYAGQIGSSLMRARSRTVANKMDVIISPSRVTEQKLRQYGVKKPIYVIPTGIEIPELLFTKEDLARKYDFALDAKVLLYVGRVSKEKNIEALLRVVKLLKGKKVNVVLLVIGPGDIEEMKKKAKKMGIGENIIFTGPLIRENAQKHYGGADAAVFSSQTETQGLTTGEAMVAGVPVVALDSPTREEFYPEDVAMVARDESDFADAILCILNNPAERQKKIEAAKRFARDTFSKKRMIERQIALFESLIKSY